MKPTAIYLMLAGQRRLRVRDREVTLQRWTEFKGWQDAEPLSPADLSVALAAACNQLARLVPQLPPPPKTGPSGGRYDAVRGGFVTGGD